MPRSDHTAGATDGHWSSRAVMIALAGGCVVLGLAAPLAIGVMYRTIDAVSPLAGSVAVTGVARVWLTAPNGLARVSPVLIMLLLTSVTIAAASMLRVRGLRLRYADTWGCGRIRQTSRMEYTSSAFAEPLRRIFSELYRPTQDLSISVHPESHYFVRSITYTSHVVPWFEKAFYDPLTTGIRTLATWIRRLQGGSVHLYLLYVATALVVALAAAWWAR
jgi:hydrogenase-4 component B